MENYIVINGKKAELTEEQLEKLGIKTEDPEEKYPPKFKVGDRVKVTCSTRTMGRGEEYKGKVFTIKAVYKLSDYPFGPARAYGIEKNYVVFENELELFENEDLFKRAYGALYHYICDASGVQVRQEYFNEGDEHLHEIGNYCRDEDIMKQRALHETLNRLLWRASVIAGELDNKWEVPTRHYYIYKDCRDDIFRVYYNDSDNAGLVYFPSEKAARDAIKNIIEPFIKEHPDFVW